VWVARAIGCDLNRSATLRRGRTLAFGLRCGEMGAAKVVTITYHGPGFVAAAEDVGIAARCCEGSAQHEEGSERTAAPLVRMIPLVCT